MPDSQSRLESGEVLDLLASLVQKSLVVYEEDEQGQGRYRLLEPMRQYAWDRLMEAGEGEAVRDRHLGFFLRLAEASAPALHRPDQLVWLARLDREHDNLRTALEWCHAGAEDPQLGLRLAAALHMFWDIHSHLAEGREHLARALSREVGRTAEGARAVHAAGYLALRQCDYAAALTWGEESLAIAREMDNQERVAESVSLLGRIFEDMGEFQKARPLQEESLAIWRAMGGTRGVARGLNNLGLTSVYQKRFTEARALLEESLAMSRESGDRGGTSFALNNLGMAALGQQDWACAQPLFTESLRIRWEQGMRTFCAWGLEGLAAVAAAQGQPDRAARLFGAADAAREAAGHPASAPVRELYSHYQAAARAEFGDEAFAAAWAEGRTMTLDQAVSLALKEPNAA